MHQFVRNFITEWRRLELPFKDETVVAAVSGGADSVSLLLALDDLVRRKKLGIRLIAAHFNHKLRGEESEMDEEFVRGLTGDRKIEFVMGAAKMPEVGNLEQHARLARYKFLSETAANLRANLIVTGHTINDQAETFLLNMIRGSGIDGLSGMRPVRDMDAETLSDDQNDRDKAPELLPFAPNKMLLVRPMLGWAKRKDTEGFCVDQGVIYRYDTMNEDTAFKRVRIRKILMPLLEDMNPKIIETLANTAELMQHACDQQKSVATEPGEKLTLADLLSLTQPELYDRLRVWLARHRGTKRQLQLIHIKAIERLITSAKSGRIAELPDGGRVVRSGGYLAFENNRVEKTGLDN